MSLSLSEDTYNGDYVDDGDNGDDDDCDDGDEIVELVLSFK